MYAVLVLLLIFLTAATDTQRRNKYAAQNKEVDPIPESVHKYIEAYANAYYKAKTAEFSRREKAASYNTENGDRWFKNEVKRLEAIHEAGWFRDYVRRVDPRNRFLQQQSEEEYAKAARTPSQLDTYMSENLNINKEILNKWTSRLDLDTEVDKHLTTNRQTNSQPENVNDIRSEFRKLEQEYYKQKDAAWNKVKPTAAVISSEDEILDYVEIIEDYQWDLVEIENKIRTERDGRARQTLLQEKEDTKRQLKENEELLNRLLNSKGKVVGKAFAEDVKVKQKGTQSNKALDNFYSHLWDLKHKVINLEVLRIKYLKTMSKNERITEMKRAMDEEIKK
ncbi:unnamed protein product [Trichobilharzia szidati]|nr:unnamed protein product [Trichobilharzia szidati]